MILKILKNPYPFNYSFERNIIVAISVAVYIFLINQLWFDDPDQRYFRLYKTEISIVLAVITFTCIIVILDYLPRTFLSTQKKENWTISKELSVISILHFGIVICNYFFLILISKDISFTLSLVFFSHITVSTFVIGFIPSSIIVWVDYTIKLKSNLKQTLQHNQKLKSLLENKKETIEKKIIHLPSNTLKEDIQFDLNNLLFIKSDGNYIEIYTIENNKLVKLFYRFSIHKIEETLAEFPQVIRTHRSYLVNIRRIKNSKGNARNYQLFFEGVDHVVPVSRNRFEKFNTVFKNLSSNCHK